MAPRRPIAFPEDPNAPRFRGWTVAIAAAFVLAVFAGGIALGVWFTTHYRIVPVDQTAAAPPPAPATPNADFALAPNAPAPAPQPAGPFTFRFYPGDVTSYALESSITGQGLDVGDPSPVDMAMASTMTLTTESVAPNGVADLTMRFENTQLDGDFMNQPFFLLTGGNQVRMSSGDRPLADSSTDPNAVQSNPQLAFLNTPIKMKATPNGDVTHISGPDGIGAILAQVPAYSDLNFPASDLDAGTSWTSEFALPVPGFPVPAEATMHNTFVGYTTYEDKQCAVIEQRIDASQQNGQLTSGKLFDDAAGFQMPAFQLDGAGTVYFDTDAGQIAYSTMDLNLVLKLSQALGPAGDALEQLLGNIGQLVGQDLPEFEGFGQKQPGQESLLDLDLDIHTTMQRMP